MCPHSLPAQAPPTIPTVLGDIPGHRASSFSKRLENRLTFESPQHHCRAGVGRRCGGGAPLLNLGDLCSLRSRCSRTGIGDPKELRSPGNARVAHASGRSPRTSGFPRPIYQGNPSTADLVMPSGYLLRCVHGQRILRHDPGEGCLRRTKPGRNCRTHRRFTGVGGPCSRRNDSDPSSPERGACFAVFTRTAHENHPSTFPSASALQRMGVCDGFCPSLHVLSGDGYWIASVRYP